MSRAYAPRLPSRHRRLPLRTLEVHCHEWGEVSAATAQRPTLVLTHGWMDVGASFQFLVDALSALDPRPRHILAPDWRGFGGTTGPACDTYWFPDYLGDLDALLDTVSPGHPVDLLGHSMGGHVVMAYAGVRPERVRRLVNVEGFGLPATDPAEAPQRLRRWLDELKEPVRSRDYTDAHDVASRLVANNPRLDPARAAWLAAQRAAPDATGRWQLQVDPAHKRVNPVLYRAEETIALWSAIEAPVLWVEGSETDISHWWGQRYPRAEFEQRLRRVPRLEMTRIDGAGHMLHHERPEALARVLIDFLG